MAAAIGHVLLELSDVSLELIQNVLGVLLALGDIQVFVAKSVLFQLDNTCLRVYSSFKVDLTGGTWLFLGVDCLGFCVPIARYLFRLFP